MKKEYKDLTIKKEIFLNNFSCFIENCCKKDKFYYEKNKDSMCYDIEQNFLSFPLLWDVIRFPDARTCFFAIIFNCFQNLPIKNDYPYCSYSQSLTTYFLKLLSRKDMIDITKYSKLDKGQLDDHKEIFGSYESMGKDAQMYEIFFFKSRSFYKEDIDYLSSIMKSFEIDASCLQFCEKEGKIYLELKKEFVRKQIIKGEIFKNAWNIRNEFLYILDEYYHYLFEDDTGRKRKK